MIDITTLTNRHVLKVKNDSFGHETLAELRRQAKIENAKSRLKAMTDPAYEPIFVRVVTFGRLGKNNPHSWIYKSRNAGFRNGYQRISLSHASEIAVYINPMKKHAFGGLYITSNFKFVK